MNKQFGALLSEGLASIAHRWHKTKGAVGREMTEKLRAQGFALSASTLEGWCRGFVPKEPEQIAWLVRYCVQYGRIDRSWGESLLYQARYPARETLLAELFPPAKEPVGAQTSSELQRLQHVDDPALALNVLPESDLVGREKLLFALKQSLLAGENRGLLALIGLPGVGKTTLALELARSHEARETFSDGMLYVNLGQHPDIEHHLERWARLLGLIVGETKLADRRGYVEAIHASIGKRRMLLVIEDAWTIEAALAFQLGGPGCAHLLSTRFSDIALRFAGPGVVKIEELNEEESRQLLARFIPGVVRDEPEQVRSLIRAVDGLPLALTLIGKHLQVHAFHRQPRRLQHALQVLQQTTERMRLSYPAGPLEINRQTSHSLLASIGTSYEALSPGARRALHTFCVFPVKPRTFSEEAVLFVSAAPPSVLDELTDAGLLESAGPGRYTLHQTIADYASLKHRGPQAEMRLVEFFVTCAQVHAQEYTLLDQEASNILFALTLAATEKMWRWLVRGVQAFFPFLILRGWYETALRYCQQELEAARLLAEQEAICIAFMHLGTLCIECGDVAQAEIYAQEGLTLARQLNHALLISTLLRLQGNVASKKGKHGQTEKYAQEGLALARELHDGELICLHLLLLGIAASKKGAYEQAEDFLQEGLDIARQLDQPRAINGILTAFGTLAGMRGNTAQAERYYQEGLEIARASKNIERVAAFLQGLGIVAGMRCDYARAENYFQEALPLAEAMGLREHLFSLSTNLATVAYYRGHGEQAEASFLQGLALAHEMGKKNVCTLLSGLGTLYGKQEKLEQAILYLEQSLAQAVEIEHHYYQCEALLALSLVLLKHRNVQRAKICLEQLSELVSTAGNEQFRSGLFNAWGEYYFLCEQIDDAAAAFQEALELAREPEKQAAIAQSLYGLARVALARGDSAAARLRGQESAQMFAIVDVYSAREVTRWLEGPAMERSVARCQKQADLLQ